MNFQTKIDIPKSSWQIEHSDKILLLGSCFADEVGQQFVKGGFDALVNPFGTLYNPASIAAQLLRAISGNTCKEAFVDNTGTWHSWMHHSRFSSSSKDELIARIDKTTEEVGDYLREANVLIITLGTAIIYRLKENGMLVANCHKQPDALFTRECLSSYDIVDQWQMLLQLLQSINPKLHIIFTVSPIRHKRDGYHTNQVSKGILLQAVDGLVAPQPPKGAGLRMDSNPDGRPLWGLGDLSYFPSYEIMLDELRDYRFYADDMIHPSPLAVQYIWERFQDTYFSTKTRDEVLKSNKERARSQHRDIIVK